MKTKTLLLSLTILSVLACTNSKPTEQEQTAEPTEEPNGFKPSMLEEDPFAEVGDKPVMLGEGVISSEAPEFATTWDPERNILAFNRTNADRSEIYIYFSSYSNGQWATPVKFEYSEPEYRDIDPFIKKGRLYFSAVRTEGREDYDIFVSSWINNQWSAPTVSDEGLGTTEDDIFISISNDYQAYYSRFMEDNSVQITRKSLYDAEIPFEVQRFENSTARMTNPAIAPDGSFLITSGDFAGEGSADLFISYPTDTENVWTDPVNLGPTVNSPYTEFAPGISPDGKYLFFTSERPGVIGPQAEGVRPPGDLYVVKLAGLVDRK
ncbi:MAG: hypothetical protein GYB31_17805 [Bacteroidetes bacterium]|nr:hypothetical protein [Bacteroidota bacterium]